MATHRRALLLALAGLSFALASVAAEDGDKGKAKVAIHWLASKPIPGVTLEKGIHTSETGDLSYLHKQPVLTSKDVAEVTMQKTEFGAAGFGKPMFMIHFRLTKEGLRKLAASCDEDGMLAVVVDDRPYGFPYYLKSRDAASFTPFAGFFSSEEEVKRIMAAFK